MEYILFHLVQYNSFLLCHNVGAVKSQIIASVTGYIARMVLSEMSPSIQTRALLRPETPESAFIDC